MQREAETFSECTHFFLANGNAFRRNGRIKKAARRAVFSLPRNIYFNIIGGTVDFEQIVYSRNQKPERGDVLTLP